MIEWLVSVTKIGNPRGNWFGKKLTLVFISPGSTVMTSSKGILTQPGAEMGQGSQMR